MSNQQRVKLLPSFPFPTEDTPIPRSLTVVLAITHDAADYNEMGEQALLPPLSNPGIPRPVTGDSCKFDCEQQARAGYVELAGCCWLSPFRNQAAEIPAVCSQCTFCRSCWSDLQIESLGMINMFDNTVARAWLKRVCFKGENKDSKDRGHNFCWWPLFQ